MPSSVRRPHDADLAPAVGLRRPSRRAVDRDPDLRQPLRERVRRRERRVRVPRRVLAGPDLRGVHRERRHGRDEPRGDVGRVPRGAQRRAGEQGVVEAEAHRRHALELQLLGRLRREVGQPGVADDGRRVARTRREHHVAAADEHDAGARAAHDARRQGHVRSERAQGRDGRDQLRRRRRRAAVLRQVRAEHVARQLVRDHHADARAHARVGDQPVDERLHVRRRGDRRLRVQVRQRGRPCPPARPRRGPSGTAAGPAAAPSSVTMPGTTSYASAVTYAPPASTRTSALVPTTRAAVVIVTPPRSFPGGTPRPAVRQTTVRDKGAPDTPARRTTSVARPPVPSRARTWG